MSFTITTSPQALFGSGGEYKVEATLSYTKDPINKKLTVTIDKVRAYSKYGWDFKTNIEVWLSTNSDKPNDSYCSYTSIAASGSNSYTGWLPKDGKYVNIGLSRTYNYNDDGTLPSIYVKVRGYNGNVKWLSTGQWVSANTSLNTNIGNTTYLETLDVRAPTVSIHPQSRGVINSKATVQFYGSSAYAIDSWQYKIDSGSANSISVKDDNNSNSLTLSDLTFTRHTVEIRGRRKYNHKWSSWESYVFDCRLPDLSDLSLTPLTTNTATLKFTSTSDFDRQYQLHGVSGTGINTGWVNVSDNTTQVTVNVCNNILSNYTFKLQRKDHSQFVQTRTLDCDTRAPVLTVSSVTVTGLSVTITVTSDVTCSNWIINLGGNIPPRTSLLSGTVCTFTIDGLTPNVNYTANITATKVSNNITGTVTYSGIKATPGAWIKTPSGYKAATVYIYNDIKKDWDIALPHIYVDGYDNGLFKDNRRHWKQCT